LKKSADERISYYRSLLREHFEIRKKKNPRYSMRAFSRFIGIDSASLCRILAGKQDLSPRACVLMIRKLGLSPAEKRVFVRSLLQDRMSKEYARLSKAVGEEGRPLPAPDPSDRGGEGVTLDGITFRLDPSRVPLARALARELVVELIEALEGEDPSPRYALRVQMLPAR
jgi:hypothetical protein